MALMWLKCGCKVVVWSKVGSIVVKRWLNGGYNVAKMHVRWWLKGGYYVATRWLQGGMYVAGLVPHFEQGERCSSQNVVSEPYRVAFLE